MDKKKNTLLIITFLLIAFSISIAIKTNLFDGKKIETDTHSKPFEVEEKLDSSKDEINKSNNKEKIKYSLDKSEKKSYNDNKKNEMKENKFDDKNFTKNDSVVDAVDTDVRIITPGDFPINHTGGIDEKKDNNINVIAGNTTINKSKNLDTQTDTTKQKQKNNENGIILEKDIDKNKNYDNSKIQRNKESIANSKTKKDTVKNHDSQTETINDSNLNIENDKVIENNEKSENDNSIKNNGKPENDNPIKNNGKPENDNPIKNNEDNNPKKDDDKSDSETINEEIAPIDNEDIDNSELDKILVLFTENYRTNQGLVFNSKNKNTLPQEAIIGLRATGENDGHLHPISWSGNNLSEFNKNIPGKYKLKVEVLDSFEISEKVFENVSFMVDVIVK